MLLCIHSMNHTCILHSPFPLLKTTMLYPKYKKLTLRHRVHCITLWNGVSNLEVPKCVTVHVSITWMDMGFHGNVLLQALWLCANVRVCLNFLCYNNRECDFVCVCVVDIFKCKCTCTCACKCVRAMFLLAWECTSSFLWMCDDVYVSELNDLRVWSGNLGMNV